MAPSETPIAGKPKPHKQALGKTGEDFAAWLLEGLGYRILDRNWSSRYGEIDIIAEAPETSSLPTLCFIEVRTSTTETLGGALQSLTRRKRSRLVRRALYYLATKGFRGPARMDFMAHQFVDGVWETVFLPDAFGRAG